MEGQQNSSLRKKTTTTKQAEVDLTRGKIIIKNFERQKINSLLCHIHTHYHYENMPMQYTAIFHGCKKDNFQMKKCDNFLIFAQNIDCGYTLEPSH